MFAAVCLGRPMQMAEQIEQAKWGITVPNASNVRYVTVFMLPNTEFTDPGYTALIYFQVQNGDYTLLGGINPDKPSGVYRINSQSLIDDEFMGDDINIGILIEPTNLARDQLDAAKFQKPAQALTKPKSANEITQLAKKIVGQAYNYLGSFVDNQGNVPMKAFDAWWSKFQAKLAANPHFLDNVSADV